MDSLLEFSLHMKLNQTVFAIYTVTVSVSGLYSVSELSKLNLFLIKY